MAGAAGIESVMVAAVYIRDFVCSICANLLTNERVKRPVHVVSLYFTRLVHQ
jgi:hypothetical protein